MPQGNFVFPYLTIVTYNNRQEIKEVFFSIIKIFCETLLRGCLNEEGKRDKNTYCYFQEVIYLYKSFI